MDEREIKAAWYGQAECARCPIRDMALFADLEEADFELIHLPIQDIRLDPGVRLYEEGGRGDSVYTLRQGMMKLERLMPDGGRRVVRLLRPGDVAGLESLIGKTYQHSAVPLRTVRLCQIPREVVDRLNRETPRLCRQLMQRWQRAVENADSWLSSLVQGPVQNRVARLLLQLLRDSGDRPFTLLSRDDMGSILGTTKESASRAVASLKRKGVLVERGTATTRRMSSC
jgi:CRP/FNR family transcriptional regulator, anaerobic regulatory protein